MDARRRLRALPGTLPPAELLTVDEAAALMHCSRRTVFRLMGAHELPSVKPGRVRLIRREDLNHYLDRLRDSS